MEVVEPSQPLSFWSRLPRDLEQRQGLRPQRRSPPPSRDLDVDSRLSGQAEGIRSAANSIGTASRAPEVVRIDIRSGRHGFPDYRGLFHRAARGPRQLGGRAHLPRKSVDRALQAAGRQLTLWLLWSAGLRV